MDGDEQRGGDGKLVGGVTGKGFMPGKSGNPGGRPKNPYSRKIKDKAEELLPRDIGAAIFKDKWDGTQTYADALVETMYRRAITKGDPLATKEILERVDGKVKDVVRFEEPVEPQAPKGTDEEEVDRIRQILAVLEEIGVTPPLNRPLQ